MSDIAACRSQMGNRIQSLRDGFWAPYAEALSSLTDDELVIDVTIQCLENTLQQVASMSEATEQGDIDFINYGFDIITAVIPNLIATEICSVQPTDRRSAELFFMEFLYASNKGRVQAGQKMFGAHKAGNDPDELANEEIWYTSEWVKGESLAVSSGTTVNFAATLAYFEVRVSTITITALKESDSSVMTITDDGSGALVGDIGSGTNTIDYVNGDFDVDFVAAVKDGTKPAIDYKWNLESNPSMIPEVDLRITSDAVQADIRAVRGFYNLMSSYDLSRAWGRSMDTELEAAMAAEIRKEIDGQILEEMRLARPTYDTSFTSASTDYVAQVEHDRGLLNAMVESANNIYQRTRRGSGNVMIVGTNVANIMEALGTNYFKPAEGTQVGPYFAGTFGGKFRVYKNPYYGVNEWVTTYRGETFIDAAYIYAPYMPYFTTKLGIREDLVGRKAAATSGAHKLVNADFFDRGHLV